MPSHAYRFELYDVVGFVRAFTRSRARWLVIRTADDAGYVQGDYRGAFRSCRLRREPGADHAPTIGDKLEGIVPTTWERGFSLLLRS